MHNALLKEVQECERQEEVTRQLEEQEIIDKEPHFIAFEIRTIQRLMMQFQNCNGKMYASLEFERLLTKSKKVKKPSMQYKSLSLFLKGILSRDLPHDDIITMWGIKTYEDLYNVEQLLQTASPSRPATLEDYDEHIGNFLLETNPSLQDLVAEARTDA